MNETTKVFPTVRRDYDAIAEIEYDCGCRDPWVKSDIEEFMKGRVSNGLTAKTEGGLVVGYVIYGVHGDRYEIQRIGVHPNYQRTGIGSKLIDKMNSRLSVKWRSRTVFSVPDDMLSVHLFLQATGFRAINVVGDRYVFRYCVRS